MAIFKCKMCGGTIEFEQGATVGVCDSCGTKQTLPKLDDDRRANLYDRANHFRRNNEFDKAEGIYEQILNEDNTDAEAYWSLVLCRYGIDYVEDPATHKQVPTVNRAQFTSIFDDDNFKSALQYADGYQRTIYEEEAAAINEIQKNILAISQKEEPFDVFICYKETDANGRRTQDSVLANDLYHQLTQEGFKVFFSRITLEDKLGTAYEPYIFAALNSAKVMVVLGTKPEHFNAVWVKNEWSRYLALVKQSGGKKVLIPAYRDMDPYDLPEEFSHLQAQDMSKLGFMQDLIRGIKKIVKEDDAKATVKETVISGGSASAAPLLKRAFMFLEDGAWNDADEYCEKVLDQDPENAQAYLGKLMAELGVHRKKDLSDNPFSFEKNENYLKTVRFGDEKLAAELKGHIDQINERNENRRLAFIYNKAVNAMNTAKNETAFQAAAKTFKTIPGYKDADYLADQCIKRANALRKDHIYGTAKARMIGGTVSNYESAIKLFQTISGWRNSDEQISVCQRKIEEIKAKEEAERLRQEREAEEKRIAKEKRTKKMKKIIAIVTPILIACIVFVIISVNVIIPNVKYNKAIDMIDDGNMIEAYESLTSLDDYKDSKEKANDICKEYISAKIKEANIGDELFFGSYEQDNNSANEKESIEWLILDKDENKILVISKYALDGQMYNTLMTDVTWETCSLRKWLNETFLKEAFNSDEQTMILSSAVTADKNPKFDTPPGNDTTDKVFLLSIPEAEKYFDSDKARSCEGTEYCYAQGAYQDDDNNCCEWWLRSPGRYSRRAAYVDSGGSIHDGGGTVSYSSYAVRPVIWISLDN